ncbi:hypothetical protein SDC9_12981 [bioreactor metagenome]|uniref:Uncharacterized protein n=1 Tax=bioreactor metagenome TaxID=1076179 RepID=A0A644TK56_9ZZZZ
MKRRRGAAPPDPMSDCDVASDQARMRHRRVDPRLGGVTELGQRQPHLGRAQAELRHRVFRAGDARFEEDRNMQRHQLVLILHRRHVIARQCRRLHLGAELRRDVRGDRDAADAAHGVEAERRRILARELDEIGPAGQALLRHAAEVAGRVLDADDARQFRQLAHGLGRHVDDRPARDVVDDDRQRRGIVHRGEMRHHAALRRLVVIGRHHERGIGAGGLGVADQLDPLGGRVRAGAGDHRHPAGGGLHHLLDHAVVFLVAQRRAFAGGADRDDAVRALRDVPLHQFLERVPIDCAVRERRDECGEGPFEHDTLLRWGRIRPVEIGRTIGEPSPLANL